MPRVFVTPIFTALLLSLTSMSQAQETDPSAVPRRLYELKNDKSFTGSNLPTTLMVTDYPLDKPYAELPAHQIARIRSLYESMPPADEPPYPISGPHTLIKAIAKMVNKLEALGPMEAVVTVGADGKAVSVSVTTAPNPRFATFLGQALMLEKFKPAVCNGAPCVMDYLFELEFRRTL